MPQGSSLACITLNGRKTPCLHYEAVYFNFLQLTALGVCVSKSSVICVLYHSRLSLIVVSLSEITSYSLAQPNSQLISILLLMSSKDLHLEEICFVCVRLSALLCMWLCICLCVPVGLLCSVSVCVVQGSMLHRVGAHESASRQRVIHV